MCKLIDETGKRYGKLTVLGLGGKFPSGKRLWRVACDCGREKQISGIALRSGQAMCGCGKHERLDRVCLTCGKGFTAKACEVARRGARFCNPFCVRHQPNRKKPLVINRQPKLPSSFFFWRRVNKNGPVPQHMPHLGSCWIIGGAPGRGGYGKLKADGVTLLAHRFSYELEFGIGSAVGLMVCHKCDTRTCVRPDHLFLGTARDNMQDMIQKGRKWNGPRHGLRGDLNGNAKLTPDQVRAIREESNVGATRAELSRKYGVSGPSIKNIATRRTWIHIA